MRYKVSVKNVRECQVLSCSRGVFRGFGRLVVVVVVSCFCFQWFALRTPTEPVSYCLTKWLFFAGFCLFLPVTSRLTRLDTGFEEMPAKTCRHEWRHGTSGDARHVGCLHLSGVPSFLALPSSRGVPSAPLVLPRQPPHGERDPELFRPGNGRVGAVICSLPAFHSHVSR